MSAFFYFSKPERKGILLLCLFLMAGLLLPKVYARFYPNDELISWESLGVDTLPLASIPVPTIDSFFQFNPNLCRVEDFELLGLSTRLAVRIENYRKKGGQFYKKTDLLKIYGMDSLWFNQVIDWIEIPKKSQWGKTKSRPYNQAKTPYRPKEKIKIYVNQADIETWQKLPGIGQYRAEKIVKFRDGLGGFTKLDQVRLTYGLPDSVFQSILPCLVLASPVKKIQLNLVGIDDLAQHPLISWKEARMIVNYRTQHGTYKQPKDLKRILGVDTNRLEQMLPYFDFSIENNVLVEAIENQ